MKIAYLFLLIFAIGCGGKKESADSDDTATRALSLAGNAEHGKQLYQTTCATCHGTEGKGDGPAAAALSPKPANHSDYALMNPIPDQRLHDIIHQGGAAFDKPGMPAAPQLSDQDINDVLAFIRQISHTQKAS